MKITASDIREVREKSGAPMLRSKQVLDEQKGNKEKAIEILKKEGFAKMEKRSDRETSAGIIKTYQHHTGNIGVLLELLAETDFVAKNELFLKLADDIVLQITSMNPKNEKELLKQYFIKDPSKKVEELIKEVTTKTGEVIRVGRFTRIEIGN